MAMPLDYSRPRLARPFREVAPIIDATNPIDAIGQIFGFMARNASYRVGVPDTSFFPFSAICRLNLTFPSGAYHGTGFYIGSGLILTCGHNLFDKTPSGSATEAATRITVRVGQQNATTWLDSFDLTPADWTAHPTWVSSAATDRGFDLGVLRVTTPPPAGEFFQLINYSPSADTPIAVCGYGSDTGVDSQRQHLDIDRIRAISNNGENVDYNLQTRGGNSGSPVFAHFTKESAGGEMPETIPVMGVHVAGESTTLNRGVLLSPDKIDWALGGGISSVSAFSLSARPGSLGGLPLARRTRGSLGGLPLGPASGTPMLRTLSWARPLERAWIVIDQTGSGGMSVAKRTFGHPTHDLSGKTKVSVRVPNMPSGGSVRWNIPDDDHKTRAIFETGGNATAHSTGGTSVTLRSTAAGPFAVDCMVKDSGGSTVESNKYWMSSPQFVLVAIHPTTDAFFDGIGMRTRRAAIVDEMKAVMRHLYRNVNIRFVFPGEALPAHLGVANNAAFPGGIEALPAVQYAEVIGADTVMDPEETQATGTPTPYGATSHGRNHEPGDLPAPMDHHALARGLIHHFADTRAEIGHVQTEAAAGRLSAGDMDLAARMYGRLMGENLSHEVGHFLANTFVAHTGGGLMQTGRDRTTRERTGMTVQANKAIVGANAFAHESGIHQDGMLKHHETYEIMRPETVGATQTTLVLGKHSGRAAFSARLAELGHALEQDELDRTFQSFKVLADKKKTLTDADIEALVASEISQPEPFYRLQGLQVACGSMGLPTATVELIGPDGAREVRAEVGTGPVDAAYKAIDGIVKAECRLLEYLVQGVTAGIDAIGEVSVRIRGEGAGGDERHTAQGAAQPRVFHGHGADTDIIVASAKAYLVALNRLLHAQKRARPEPTARVQA